MLAIAGGFLYVNLVNPFKKNENYLTTPNT